MTHPKLPKRLYKYRAFNTNTLRLLTEAEVYYANPATFNDPLDCGPTIHVDADCKSLERLCYRMLVSAYGKDQALREMGNHRYMSTEHGDYKADPQVEAYYMRDLALHVKRLLDQELEGRGVLSLAERWNCPLMWSHYADQHRGVCIEYDMTDNVCPDIQRIDYRRPRSIRISNLIEWKIQHSKAAEKAVIDTFFFAKAPQWRYEREWRHIADKAGANSAPVRVSGVYFGLRCDTSVITAMVKLHTSAERPIRFYEVFPLDDSFRLARRLLDSEEIASSGPRSSALLDFKDVFVDESDTQPVPAR